jgi:tRNA (guanine26-N2/guanine27-N2)-dimethyltransferase
MSTLTVPDGYTVHTENSARIFLNKDEAFLNPVQEFNRDLSVACIRVWSEELARSKREKWAQRMEQKEVKRRRSKNRLYGVL